MGKVIELGCLTKLDIPADKVLEGAIGKMEGVVVLGWDKNDELYFASTYADGGTIIWLLEVCKKRLLTPAFNE